MRYIPVIGLEIHCELLTKSKVFCSCRNSFGGGANTRVCPRCAGFPGTLPSLNQGAAELAVKAGLALGCDIHNYSAFDRKNYFYPDLPKAYQITQFYHPICTDGSVTLKNGAKIRVSRIHIEEDAGKLTHGVSATLADYNRCGVPLIEIVTAPDFRSVSEVWDFVGQVGLRLKYAGVCSGRMEQGSLRVDVNISLMQDGSDILGTRAEIKNLNSLKSIGRAIEFEIKRQSDILESGGALLQETRRFSDVSGKTYSMRGKEEANDYRYFPEPDIPPIFLQVSDIEKIASQMPEMPRERFLRYTNDYGLPSEDAELIISDMAFSDFYDEAVKINPDYKHTANLMLVELNRNLNETGETMENIKFSPSALARTVKMMADGLISNNAAKEIVSVMFNEGGEPDDIADRHGLIMSSDVEETEKNVRRILEENRKQALSYKKGNKKVFGYLMGQIMRASGGGANPKMVQELLLRGITDMEEE